MYTRHLKICAKFKTSLCIDVTLCHVVLLVLVTVVGGIGLNPLAPNDVYIRRTTQLTSRC